MKTLGIIGGLGPESTLDYYQRIIALFRERTGDRHYPEFVIVSVDLRKGLDFMDANDLNGMANYLLEGIDKLARAGLMNDRLGIVHGVWLSPRYIAQIADAGARVLLRLIENFMPRET